MKIKLKQYQDNFLYSPYKFPAMVSGWGTGKSMLGILRSVFYAENIPENLGVIFRKEYTDLRDSTVVDFETYTGRKINSKREVEFKNGSKIMFRHIEELNNIQNINLGYFMIEQAEELETDKEFFTLFGRLRRQNEPTETFKKLKLNPRSGWIVANTGADWIKRVWKENEEEDPDFHLVEAKTWENKDVLPDDFVESLKKLEHKRPELYKRYVLNSWDVADEDLILIPERYVNKLKGIEHYFQSRKRIVSCDPAMGGDECVIQVIENGKILDQRILYERDSMKVAAHIKTMSTLYRCPDIVIDSIGLGAPIADRIDEMDSRLIVQKFNSAEGSTSDEFLNRRAEAYFYTAQQIINQQLPYIDDEKTRKQLTSLKYKPITSKKLKIEPKHEFKKRMDESSDRADCYSMAIWGLQNVDEWYPKNDVYNDDESELWNFNSMTT